MNRGRKVKIFLSFCLVLLISLVSGYYIYFHRTDNDIDEDQVLGVQENDIEVIDDGSFSNVPYIDSLPPLVAYEGVLYEYLIRVMGYEEEVEISLEYVEGPSWLSLRGDVLRGVPPVGSEGSYKIVLRVSDEYNSSVQENYIVVEESNDERI
jgi:hypothetical protein